MVVRHFNGGKVMKQKHYNFLLELLRTKGLAFTLDQCAVAAETEVLLIEALQQIEADAGEQK